MSQGRIREGSKVVLSCKSHSGSTMENSEKLAPHPILGFTALKRAFRAGAGMGKAQVERRSSSLLLIPKLNY